MLCQITDTSLISHQTNFPALESSGEILQRALGDYDWLTGAMSLSEKIETTESQSDNTQAPPSQPGGKYCVTDRD